MRHSAPTRSEPKCWCRSLCGQQRLPCPRHTLPRAHMLMAKPDVPGLPLCLSLAGLWAAKPVQCAMGDYLPGDYNGWKRWRDALPSVAHI